MGFKFNSKDDTVPNAVFNWRLFWVTFVAAGGSIIWGYDQAFIGGCFALPAFRNDFNLTEDNYSVVQSHMVIIFQGACFFAVILAYWFNERFGRRRVLISACCIFLLGVVLQMSIHGTTKAFYVGRVLCGLGIGIMSFIVPQYLAECAPASARGGIVGCFEIGIQIGISIGFWINYGANKNVSPTSSAQWYIPIGFQLVPVAMMTVGLLFLVESPRWYYLRGRREEAGKTLSWLRNLPVEHPYVAQELADYERQMEEELSITSKSGFKAILAESLNRKMAPRIIHGCVLMLFQNSTGINAMQNFSVTFFKVLGFHGTSAQLFSTGIYGIVKGLVGTLAFLFLVDRYGRRPLLLAGSVLCAFSMYYVAAYAAITGSFTTENEPGAAANSAAAFIYIFGCGYAIGWNLPWVICAEIFPTRIRSFCLVITTCAHWVGEFYVSYSLIYMFRDITYGTFLFFASMTVLGGIYVYLMIPETKGVRLENMDILFGTKGLAPQKMKAYEAEMSSNTMGLQMKEVTTHDEAPESAENQTAKSLDAQ